MIVANAAVPAFSVPTKRWNLFFILSDLGKAFTEEVSNDAPGRKIAGRNG
jgi:hypothetical protein